MSDSGMLDYQICPDVTFSLYGGDIIASNHRVRRHVCISSSLFLALCGIDNEGELYAYDRTRFSYLDGLLADPTCYNSKSNSEKIKFGSLQEAWQYLLRTFILIKDLDSYKAYFARKTTVLDNKHFGTFHQQLGAELILRQRKDPSQWWYEQKFDAESGLVKDTLYKYIQDHFIKEYLADYNLNDKVILDFGCGSGMASGQFIQGGARVIGVDPDENLLQKAKTRLGERFEPIHMEVSAQSLLGNIPEKKIDMVWMSDVFLFYFYPMDAGKPLMAPEKLLGELTRSLKDEGICVIMQPHGVFWLSPWLGHASMPYTIITEYLCKKFSVVPGLQELSNAIFKSGLLIRRIFEPSPLKNAALDAMANAFASNFPLWWVFECIKSSSPE
ncbi:MAG: methyltransferase domain-containing protein [Candidatus Eremiobacteraeota bacterium]|nr:methyltransferase domain-containing protein [Candidatus Eremiobacteraeota bacterium]